MKFPLAILVIVSTAFAAPPVFVLQPVIISGDMQVPGNPQLLLAAAPEGQVLLIAGKIEPNKDNGEYVEKYENYDEGSKNEGMEDYNEKTEENNEKVEDYNEKTEDYNEKSEEYNEKEDYNEKKEDQNEKTEEYNEKNEEYTEKTENYDEKFQETTEVTEGYNEKYEEHDTTPSVDYVEKEDDTLQYETKDYEENGVEGSGGKAEDGNSENREGKSSDKRETPESEENTKQLREEIVLGSQNKGEVTSTPGVVKLAPPLKETEEVQLAPVVYHVSPKELPSVPKQ
ncbi:hypothetical protein L9F63_000608 [Diploptera punctata]|uniref:Uncharacterized protein n=1 Tax=Diploptera punctata TaxID=6984 RepID=A0AAD8ESJ2_DIPPU|nr:hypothetical protein L9F63_000608 [Diploptera punctata]